ncbi:extracellular solute-binding protein [Actinacidiphila guanduensis]|jgi:multiple sugar transport system substrate-binding protein|uniref:Carbohydrate ABC transporter substrate-binding protein, CUT1 family n=1 Tax=Actinacidiphila guanduensis TaxID=310781 RepID=A0A1G9X668_9ACTN|nr:extracellular solute-binding protein [Actinacidiphila guanduensis]SDM91996.1 carbohydrate ABC transporter substrate-binding protein, CUT1 family [Actinacidiphila guanduensis]
MSGALARRRFLALGGLALSGGLAAACSSPLASGLTGSQPDTADVIFWNLFTGGDGANMVLMEDAFRKAYPRTSVEATILGWGNPYYTKLALATASGTPPDVGISHLSRLPLLAASGLLEPIADTGLTGMGVTPDRFTPAAWKKATVDGTVYAVPLDTHPFVLFYNIDLARKAGLLNAAGDDLKPMSGAEDFTGALKAMKDAGAQYGAAMSITADPSTAWRFFSMIYSGLAGPVVTDSGTKISIDAAAMEETFAFMRSLTSGGLMPSSLNGSGANALFSTGKAGFLFDGEWQIPSYRLVKGFRFNVVPFPALLGPKPVAYADSHALVIPHNPRRSAGRTRNAALFVRSLLDNSAIWAHGGHVPAWLPTQRSKAFLDQSPQRNYVQAAFSAVYDPVAWYTGAGSDFQNTVGATIIDVLAGRTGPKAAVSAMRGDLKRYTTARPPVRMK